MGILQANITMRILYCNKYNFRFSGTEAYLFEAMEVMRSRGHEVALFSMADERGAATAYDRHFVPFTNFKQTSGFLAKPRLAGRAIYSTDARKRIGRVIEDFKPDVAHVRNIYHHLSPSILWELKSQGVPVLYHINDFKLICPSYNLVSWSGEVCERCQGGKFWNVVREGCYSGGRVAATVLAAEAYVHKWISTYAKCVNLILAPSNFVKQKLIENGWAQQTIQVLPHFQNCAAGIRQHPGANAPILYFGRLSAEKGVDDLVAAMRRVPHLELVIAGEGPQRSHLERLARDFGLVNVRFVGQVAGPELESLIADSQFTLFPSRAYETMGKSILESYAQGRPVIASDLGSRRELVEDGETGILYRVKDIDQLSAAISFLHARPELARKMGEAGRELVRTRHSQEKHFFALEKIYEELAADAAKFRIRAFTKPSLHARVRSDERTLKVGFIGGRGVVGKYSGIETYYEEVGSRLAAVGYEVTAYCRSHFTPAIAKHRGIRIVRLPTIRTKHLETLVHSLLSTVHACFGDYDVVHYHTLGPSIFALLPRLFGKTTVVSVQGLDWKRKKWGKIARLVLKFGEWCSARFPAECVVVSQTLRGYYRLQYGKECAYIPNGTHLRNQCRGHYLRALGLEPDGYVLFLGRFTPEKNCHLLIEAFEKLNTPMKLLLGGGSSHTDDYVAELRKRESDRIKILDWLAGEALEEVLTNAALFVLPSDMEGMSLALLDAMGAGVCVLASDVPENLEAIRDAGFTFKAGDVRDLQQVMEFVLSHPTLRENVGRKAKVRVRENYLWETVVEQTSSVYKALVVSRARVAGLRSGKSLARVGTSLHRNG